MASSSSSSSRSESFDVFLSFRGEDTRRGFVSHLEKEFRSKAIINTFKDDEKLQAGDRVSDELSRAIENSKFAVVVISKNYASSGWCLNELEKIIECQEKGMLTIVPIFYEVSPSDVRYQIGTFAEAFEKHNVRLSPQKVQEWRDALKKVASLSGKDSRNSPDDAALVSEVVGDITQRLISMEPKDFDGIIGMDAHLKELDPLLNMGSVDEVRMIGIWGMGGVGKTTIADYLYRMYKHRFQFHCFIRNIKKIYGEEGLEKLLRLCLSRILKDEKFMSETTEIDSNTIKSRLRGQKILAVLDDVDDLDQLDALAKHTTWFGLGSRIIVTTRESDLFIKHGIELVYKVRCLNDHGALRLFNHLAFGGKQVSNDFTELSKRVLELVKGLPLAIKVLGKALRGRKIREWNAIIDKLEKAPDKSIMDCLKVSYDGLDDRAKDIFLTIACLFSGEYVSHLLQLLDDEGCEVSTSLNTLAEKALFDISKQKAFLDIFEDRRQVTVHDLIQDMAKEIVCQQSNKEPWKQRFLWDHKDIYDVLANGKEAEAIEGISLDMSKITKFPMRSKSFENMPNLKFLVIRNTSNYKGDMSQLRDAINHLPPGLKLLDWHNCPLTTLPLTFEAECLVDLRLPHSHLEKLSVKDLHLGKLQRLEFQSCHHLKEILKLPRNIVEINFSGTNIRGMPEIPNLPTLKILNLSNCRELLEIPNTIGNLSSLQTLNLQFCNRLLEIPSSIGDLTALGQLNLSWCGELTSIPDTVGGLTSLQALNLRSCRSLLEIPSSIGDLTTLGQLDLSLCGKLTSIPDRIGNLAALRKLLFSGKLTSIPDTIGSLTSLEHLNVQSCMRLLEIPSTIGNLTLVKELGISNCRSVRRIPDVVGNLTTLRHLFLTDCFKLESIPSTIGNLTSLEHLYIKGCQMLMEIPSIIGDLKALKWLHLEDCNKLVRLPDTIGNLTTLEELNLSGMMLLDIPSSIGNLKALKCLWLEDCNKLVHLPDIIGNLTALEELNLSGMTLLDIPSSIGNLKALKCLRLEDCNKLVHLPDTIGNLTTLEEFYLSGMTLLDIPSSIGNLKALKCLQLEDCNKLVNLPDTIGNLTTLEELYLLGMTLLDIPSSIGNLKALKHLTIKSCEKLWNILETIMSLTALERLMLSGCMKLSEIPSSIGNLKALQFLSIENCKNLWNIPETIGNLTTLGHLSLLGCTTLSEIPTSIGNLRALQFLSIKDCKNLWNIPETIGNLTALGHLSLSGCTKLSKIPSAMGNLRALKHLSLSNCENLQSIMKTIRNFSNLQGLKLSGYNMCFDISSIISNMTRLQHLSPPEDIDCIWKIIKEHPSRNLFSIFYGFGPEVIQAQWHKSPGNQAMEVLYLFRDRYDPKYVPCRCTKFLIFHGLRKLSLRNLNLQEIPDDFGHLQSLQHLDLSGNDFENIPASIKQFLQLEQLVLSHCRKIRSIPELSPGLKYLYANYCSSLESISNVSSHHFHELMLSDCFKLGEDPWEFIQHMIFSMPGSKGEIETKACFTASELPTCFSHQSAEQRLTICCSKVVSGSKPMGFVAGVVVACGNLKELYQKRCEKRKYLGLIESFCDISHLNIHCRWHGEGYQSKHISFDLEKLPLHVSVTTSGSDLLFVFSCNFGEEKSCDVISFQFDFEWKTETERFTLFSIEELQQILAIKRCGIRLCFSEELQHAQSIRPLTSGIHVPDIDELVEEGNRSNLTSSDQSENGGNLNRDEEALAPISRLRFCCFL